MADLEFFFDPVCPWAWITSRWALEAAGQLDAEIKWSPIALAILNEDKDYDELPPRYRAGHGTGRNLLRVIEAVKAAEGDHRVIELYTRFGTDFHTGDRELVTSGWEEGNQQYLDSVGLGPYVKAANDASIDEALRASTEDALSRTGDDVGTPIITFAPPDGPSFFGPVMSEIPRGDRAVELWHAVRTIAEFPGMAELKRSARGRPVFT
jgi:hypothetical protein